MERSVARVAFDSPLPQLDRLFDYSVPESLQQSVSVGCLVKVPFGRGKKPQSAYVVQLLAKSEFDGDLSPVDTVESPRSLLPEPIYRLCRAIADRQAVTLGDVLRSAVPNRAVRVDKNWTAPNPAKLPQRWQVQIGGVESLVDGKPIRVVTPRPQVVERHGQFESAWLFDLVESAAANLARGESSIVCLPDFRDVERFASLAKALELGDFLNVYSKSATPSEQYSRHLLALENRAQVLVGSRSVLLAPVANLGEIFIWDDEDQSHSDQASPYLASRELALLRQSLDGCRLTFASHLVSVPLARLARLGYIEDQSKVFNPDIAFSESKTRFDSLSFNLIRNALKMGPVLVQVANVGIAAGLYCGSCSKRSQCSRCGGGLWLDRSNRATCRACGAFNLDTACLQCGSKDRSMGRAGSQRTVEEIGKAFPGVRVSESVAANDQSKIGDESQIVVATPGLAPLASHGYAGVVSVDSNVFLARDSLSATEEALRIWANAFALLRDGGKGAVIGVPPQLGTAVATGNLRSIIDRELDDRMQLGFPPAARVLSATGARDSLNVLKADLESIDGVRILGISTVSSQDATPAESRLVATYNYQAGAAVASAAKSIQLKLSGTVRVSTSGRARRPLTIKMDDPRVL